MPRAARFGVTSATRQSLVRVGRNKFRTRKGKNRMKTIHGSQIRFRQFSNTTVIR